MATHGNLNIFVNAIPKVPKEWLGDMVRRLKEEDRDEFFKQRETLLDAYEGENLRDITEGYFTNKKGKVQSSVPNAEQNLINRAVRRMSLVYKRQPDYDVENWPDGYNPVKRWLFMKAAERTANNIGTILLRPVIRDEKMTYDLLTQYIPFFGDDPQEPTGILYSIVTPSADPGTPDVKWVFWTDEVQLLLSANGKVLSQADNLENVNPIGMLPFVTVNIREGREYWRRGHGLPLLDANTAVNVALTEMRLGVRFTLMGQWVVSGVNKDVKVVIGVDQTVNLGDNPEARLEAIAPPAEMSKAVEYLKAEYSNAFQNIGMQVQFSDEGGVPSGESLKVKNIELLERREDDVPVWLEADTKLYEIEQKLWKAEGLGNLPERSVNFAEIEFPITPTEQQAQDEWDINHGQLTEAQILLRDNPDGYESEKAAQEQVTKNKTANTPTRTSGRSPLRERFNGQQRPEQVNV